MSESGQSTEQATKPYRRNISVTAAARRPRRSLKDSAELATVTGGLLADHVSTHFGGNASHGDQLPLAPVHALKATRVITKDPNRMDADYVLFGELGRGGMGVVKLARQCSLDRLVAMKILRPEKLNHAGSRDRFLVEAMVMSSLDHPGIPPVVDMGIDDEGLPFYCMKRVTGMAWSQAMRKNGIKSNLEVLNRVCDVVSYAHSQQILHRDIKPANIMLGDYGEVFLMDWGLAVEYGSHGRASKLTSSNALAGSPSYMPPESALGQINLIDQRSDIYLLGACLFEAVVGKPPHKGRDFDHCVENAKKNIFRPFRKQGPLIDIAMKAMSTNSEDRYQSVQEFQKALEDYQEQGQSERLTARASDLLSQAIKSSDYQSFAKACFAFEEALDRWPQNNRAQHGLTQAKIFYAFVAVENDDLDLAQSLISNGNPLFNEVESKYNEARQRQSEHEVAAKELAAVKAGVERERLRSWIVIYQANFSDDYWRGEWQTIGGTSQVNNAVFHRHGGRPQITTLNKSLVGDLRASARILITQSMQRGVALAILGRRHDAGHLDTHSGYRALLSDHGRVSVQLQRDGVTVASHFLEDWSPRHWQRIALSMRNGTCTIEWNGQTVITWQDRELLLDQGRDRCGFVSWSQDLSIADFRVERLGFPLRASIVDLAEDHLHQGHFTTASHLFEDALLSQAARQHVGRIEAGRRAAADQIHLIDNLPMIQKQLQSAYPDVSVTINQGLLSVDFKHSALIDASILEGLPIAQLAFDGSAATDLSALESLPLYSLTINRCPVQDVSFLADTHLDQLTLRDCAVSDLSVLANLPLTRLHLERCPISDLGWCRALPLRHVRLIGLPVSRLSDLAHAELTELRISDCPVTSIAELNLSRLAHLELKRCQFDSLPALTRLQTLSLRAMPITSLNPVGSSPLIDIRLQEIELHHWQELKQFSCSRASFTRCQFNNLAVIQDWPLQHLRIDQTQVRDLAPLAAMPLQKLAVNHCPILDWKPLSSLDRLLVLEAWDCPANTPLADDCLPALQHALINANILGNHPVAQQQLDQLSAWRQQDLSAIEPIVIADRQYLFWPALVSYDEAVAKGASMNLQLAEISNEQTQSALAEAVPFAAWFGLIMQGHDLRWNFRNKVRWTPDLSSTDRHPDAGLWRSRRWAWCNSQDRLAGALYMM